MRRTLRQHLRIALCALLLPLSALAADAGETPFLWQVRHGTTTHYLLGSVHLLPTSALPLPAALQDAYAATQGIILETDLAALEDPQTQADLLEAAQAPNGLEAMVPRPLYRRLEARLQTLGVPLETSCQPYKPWFCAMTLEALSFARAGFEADNGIDQQFYLQAQRDDKPIGWLEAPDAHLALFTRMPDAMGIAFLDGTLDELDDAQQSPRSMFEHWRSNDSAAIERITQQMKREQPRLYARLLANRTRAWLPALKTALDGDAPQLVIVGAAHLVGADGLVQLLRGAGYDVRPVSAIPAEAPISADPLPVSSPRH